METTVKRKIHEIRRRAFEKIIANLYLKRDYTPDCLSKIGFDSSSVLHASIH